MSRVNGYKCDNCGGFANLDNMGGWWRLDSRPDERIDYAIPAHEVHACGAMCAQELILKHSRNPELEGTYGD